MCRPRFDWQPWLPCSEHRGQSALSLWPLLFGTADFGGAAAAAELGVDGGAEAVAALGVLALQAQAQRVWVVMGDACHDEGAPALLALYRVMIQGQPTGMCPQ